MVWDSEGWVSDLHVLRCCSSCKTALAFAGSREGGVLGAGRDVSIYAMAMALPDGKT